MKGFTLLEVLLSLLLFTAGFTSLSMVLSQGLSVSGGSESSLVAVKLAQEKMEQIKNTAYASISNEAKLPVGGFSSFQREVVVTTPMTGLKQVSVNVYWFDKADELEMKLVTYVASP